MVGYIFVPLMGATTSLLLPTNQMHCVSVYGLGGSESSCCRLRQDLISSFVQATSTWSLQGTKCIETYTGKSTNASKLEPQSWQ